MSPIGKILSGGKNNIGGDYYAIYKIVGEIAVKLGNDIDNILYNQSNDSPSGFLRKAYSQSSSKAVYFAPRNANDGFPPRQNTLKNIENFSSSVKGSISTRGFKIVDEVELTQGYRYMHKSIFGKTKGKAVYPWIWIDEGTTYENRFTGNPRNINQAFTRDWHTQGYRGMFIRKVGTELSQRGWDVTY